MVQAADILIDDVKNLRRVIAAKAKKYKRVPMIGRTHGVHAEPITFGLKMALMYDEFGRALDRLERARDTIAVGKISGAVGTYAHMNPQVEAYVCRKLGLQADKISTQIVQRDRHAEFHAALALVGCSIDRWALEFRHLQRTEVLEAEEYFAAGQKGSSAMPHKRNPITCERLCGLARVLRGNALAAMENVALWHERDISHSSVERVILPDSTTLLDYMLVTLTNIVDKLLVYPERMKANLEASKGLIYSQAVLLALTKKGMTREKAYEIVQRNAMKTWADAKTFKEFLLEDAEVMKLLTKREVEALFDLDVHMREVDNIFEKVGIRVEGSGRKVLEGAKAHRVSRPPIVWSAISSGRRGLVPPWNRGVINSGGQRVVGGLVAQASLLAPTSPLRRCFVPRFVRSLTEACGCASRDACATFRHAQTRIRPTASNHTPGILPA